MKLETSSLHKAATYVLLHLEMGATSEAHSRIKKLEAEARTAWGKYHNQSEEIEDALEAARSEKTLELWTVQGKLDACLTGKK